VLFDWLGSDDTPPLGVMALWPINRISICERVRLRSDFARYWLDNCLAQRGPCQGDL
jgi:hypothetical protein